MVGNMTRFGEYKERILYSGEQKYKWKQRFGRPTRRRKNIILLVEFRRKIQVWYNKGATQPHSCYVLKK